MDDKNINGSNIDPDDDFVIGKGFQIDETPNTAVYKGKKAKHTAGKSAIKTTVDSKHYCRVRRSCVRYNFCGCVTPEYKR